MRGGAARSAGRSTSKAAAVAKSIGRSASRRPSRAAVGMPNRGAERPSRERSSPRARGDDGTGRDTIAGFRRELEKLPRRDRDEVIDHLQDVISWRYTNSSSSRSTK